MSEHPKDRASQPPGPGQDGPAAADSGDCPNGRARLRSLAGKSSTRIPEVRPEKVGRD